MIMQYMIVLVLIKIKSKFKPIN